MEQMGYAMAELSALIYGPLAGMPIGIAVAVVCRKFRIRAIWVSVVTTLVAFAGLAAGNVIWLNAQQARTTGDVIRNIFWVNFVMIGLVVIAGIQWLVWLLEVVALVYWKRRHDNSNPQSTP